MQYLVKVNNADAKRVEKIFKDNGIKWEFRLEDDGIIWAQDVTGIDVEYDARRNALLDDKPLMALNRKKKALTGEDAIVEEAWREILEDAEGKGSFYDWADDWFWSTKLDAIGKAMDSAKKAFEKEFSKPISEITEEDVAARYAA